MAADSTASANASASLGDVVRHEGFLTWLAAAQGARLPAFMTTLAFVVAASHETGTYGTGGLMVTAYTLAAVAWSPFGGRILDRVGPATGAVRALWAAVVVLSGLTVAIALEAPPVVLIALAGLAGAVPAGIGGAMRSLLSDAVPKRLLMPAIAIDATCVEIMVVTGPLIIALLLLISPVVAMAAIPAFACLAALLTLRLRAHQQRRTTPVEVEAESTIPAAFLRNPRYLFWLASSVAFGQALGTAETCAYPVAERLGGGSLAAALLVGALALTAASAGLAYGAFASRVTIPAVRQAQLFLLCLITGCLLLGFAGSWLVVVIAMIVVGVATAPLNAVRSQAAEADIAPQRRAEAFSILLAAQGVGFAMGGLFLALLPLSVTLGIGGASAACALLFSLLIAGRLRVMALAEGSAGAGVGGGGGGH